jgi:phenylalanyl-tRNA synthetase beta subunit
MSSDRVRTRFERGVDYDTVLAASDRALALILALAGGQPVRAEIGRVFPGPPAKKVAITAAEVERALVSCRFSAAKIKSILESLVSKRPPGRIKAYR